MSREMKLYITGKGWRPDATWSPVDDFYSNAIKYYMDSIESFSTSPCSEAEALIREKVIKEYQRDLESDDEFSINYAKSCVDSLRFFTLDDVRKEIEERKKLLEKFTQEKNDLTTNRYKCVSTEVYDRIGEEIESLNSCIEETIEDINALERFVNGMSFLLFDYKDFMEPEVGRCTYVIGYTIL